MMDIIKSKASFDTEPAFVRGAVDAFDKFDLIILDLQRHLTADAAKRANAFNLAVIIAAIADLLIIHHGGRHQCARRAGLNTFTAGHTSAIAHGIGKIKCRIGIMAAARHADHIIDLHFAAGAHAQPALNAGIQVYAHRHMAVIQQRNAVFFQFRHTAFANTVQLGHIPQMRGFIMRHITLGLIRQQHFNHNFARIFGAGSISFHHHALLRFTNAGCGQSALAFDLDHTGAAVAIGPVSGRRLMAQMRDHQTAAIGNFPNGHTALGFDLLSIERKTNGVSHLIDPYCTG